MEKHQKEKEDNHQQQQKQTEENIYQQWKQADSKQSKSRNLQQRSPVRLTPALQDRALLETQVCGTDIRDAHYVSVQEIAHPLISTSAYNGIFIGPHAFMVVLKHENGTNYVAKTRVNEQDSIAIISTDFNKNCSQTKVKLNQAADLIVTQKPYKKSSCRSSPYYK